MEEGAHKGKNAHSISGNHKSYNAALVMTTDLF